MTIEEFVTRYKVGKTRLLHDIRPFKTRLEEIVKNGITTDEDRRLAVITVCVVLGELYYEDQIMDSPETKNSPWELEELNNMINKTE